VWNQPVHALVRIVPMLQLLGGHCCRFVTELALSSNVRIYITEPYS
jgi:hypothetical protein